MASMLDSHGLSRIGAVDAFIVTTPSDMYPVVGSIVLGVESGAVIAHATLYDAVRCDFLHGLRDASIGARSDLQKRAIVRLADAIERGFEPDPGQGLPGQSAKRPRSRDKRSAVARKFSPIRAVSGDSSSSARAGRPVTPAMLNEKRRNADIAAAVPWADATFVALVAEVRRSLRTIQTCDLTIDVIVKDRFSKGLKVPMFQRRAMSTTLTALRADIAGLEAAPFLDLRHGIEGHLADAARSVLDDQPKVLAQGIGALRSFVAIHRVRSQIEVERLRCGILAALTPAPDASDHDRLQQMSRSVEEILCAGGVPKSWRDKVGAGSRGAAEAVKYLDYDQAEARLEAVCKMLP